MAMEAGGWARALHVLGVVLWIGGVAMVTTVLLPVARRLGGNDGFRVFEWLEGRFAAQARGTTLLVGLSQGDPGGTLRWIARGHWVLLVLTLVTVAGAVAGSHGLPIFGR